MAFFKKLVGTVTSILGVDTGYQNPNAGYAADGYDPYYDENGYAQDEYQNVPYDDEQGAYAQEYDEPEPAPEPASSRRRPAYGAQRQQPEDEGNVFGNHRSVPRDNVVPMNNGERKQQQVARVENLLPEVSDQAQMNAECETLINHLLTGEILVISTENIDEKQRSRMVLMLSGAAFAVKAAFIRVNVTTYMVAPEGVKVIEADERPKTQAPFFGQNDFFTGFR